MHAPNSTQINSKLPNLGTTIFTIMSAMAREYNAINLSQGFPDFDCDSELIDLVTHYMKSGANQYAPMTGRKELRDAIAQTILKVYDCELDSDEEITVVSGASEAIFNAIAAVIKPGDEVIILEPAYDLYKPVTELFGGQIVPVPLNIPDYSVDWNKVKAAISPKTKLIIINTPHNPSGTTLKDQDLQTLQELVKGTNILIISDEVYEHIIFDKQQHCSVLRYPELKDRSFAVFSFGKTFHATGWKIGYCVAPPALSKEFRKIHQFNTFATFTPAQLALADFLQNPDHYQSLGAFYQERRDKFQVLMRETPFELMKSEGTYFQLASYGHLSQENDLDYVKRLTKEVGVAMIPLSPFYGDSVDHKMVRFCFAKRYDTLEQAVEKLTQNSHLLSK